MDYITRVQYLNSISRFVDKPIVKVLTGLRRVGKSTLLEMIRYELLSHIKDEHILFLNFESKDGLSINNAKKLVALVSERFSKDDRIYLFFDEIQLVSEWEKAINVFRVDFNADIYITGSNSKLLSTDISTVLAGRTVNFHIQPFTFKEYKHLLAHLNLTEQALFNAFVQFGGMPFIKYFDLEKEATLKYLMDVYNTVIVKDVLEYNKIRDVDLFNRILRFVIQNIGSTFSALSIVKFLKSEQRKVSVDTVLSYLRMLEEAFVIQKIVREDLIGKKVLKVDEKYYLSDHGFREALGYSNTQSIEKVLENIVLNEMQSRGYEVKIGKVNDLEVDFVAQKHQDKLYIQVSYLLASPSTIEREFKSLSMINDNYPKYVLSMDQLDFSHDGIIHMNIIDFLKSTDSNS
ncbi:ATP-binding protein [Macrococcoides canis]|uniref:AAA family ATPase n=1 Tax=Macrococcoides canis TaxID=1855823 RepID=A0AAE6X1H8_9STAP|nr:ATP-binding protein [Macrococcus canis]QCT74791.1 ATP-binding protein [Macrococcus canis]QIH78394.1 AAA family ATPase [Macrococcus canis]